MADYQRMYAVVCAAASDALDLLPENGETAAARAVLQKALLEAEELYISAPDMPLAE